MAYRIGVDVGGTFTDAVLLDAETMNLVGIVKVPTTHHHPNGVAEGIRLALCNLLEKYAVSASEVRFIAHGTTQATNALLEGDVARVAVFSTAKGLGAALVKSQTHFESLPLSAGNAIPVESCFLRPVTDEAFRQALATVRDQGIRAVVVATPYSVDDPTMENHLRDIAVADGFLCTPTHEMTSLYGLRTRTRTAVLNASILEKMIATTDFMAKSVCDAGIAASLMIMRSDGGVMCADEMHKRPIQTILSGPAAGVAGAIMYAGISEGVFLEVGGTSTDISVIHNGQVMVRWARICGHKTYTNALDIRTVAFAGGSMLRADGNRVLSGPRSAHIANLPYLCFAEDVSPEKLCLERVRVHGDLAEYFVVRDQATGKQYAPTLTCLANWAGLVDENDFARGHAGNVQRFMELLAVHTGKTPHVLSREIFDHVCTQLLAVIEDLVLTYQIDKEHITLVGGGGGAAAIGPLLARFSGYQYASCPNAEAISPIGVAMAMVRETAERHLTAPTKEDFLRLREKVVRQAVAAGAVRECVQVEVEFDPKKGLVRAVASGVTDSRFTTLHTPPSNLSTTQSLLLGKYPNLHICEALDAGALHIFTFRHARQGWFARLFRQSQTGILVVAGDGTIRLRRNHGAVCRTTVSACMAALHTALDTYSNHGDAGEKIPDVFVLLGSRILDYSKIRARKQLCEIVGFDILEQLPDEPIYILLGL